MELGCGVGLPSVVALDRGADTLATDHYAAALDFAAHNARLNTGRALQTAVLDWHAPETEGVGTFDLVVAADVLYEERNVPALARLVSALLAPGGEAVFADPGRRWEPLFREIVEAAGFRRETEEAGANSGGRGVRVLLHHLRPRTSGA